MDNYDRALNWKSCRCNYCKAEIAAREDPMVLRPDTRRVYHQKCYTVRNQKIKQKKHENC